MLNADKKIMVSEKPFLNVLKGSKQASVPFWFMRQAGRYLPEYRELRAQKGGFLEMALDPVSACEVTLQPIRRFGMDAAIIFSDILMIPYALGQSLAFEKGEGPKLDPVRTNDELLRLSMDEFDARLQPVYDALKETRSALKNEGFDHTALIGFAGAPWTVATYMIEGGGSKDFAETKKRAYGDPVFFKTLIDLLIDSTSRYLIAQVNAGAEALQIFDSWAGALDARQFKIWSIDPIAEIVRRVRTVHPDIPIIGFPKGAGLNYLSFVQETKIDAVGLDFSVPTAWAAKTLQPLLPVQGNLDPMCLLAGGKMLETSMLETSMLEILGDLSAGPFVFNLGHGIHKDTPVSHVEAMVKLVREYKA
jgi:uroporphyrinogen decarboxylase